MHATIRNALDSKICLKVSSLIIGYLLWSIIGESFSTSRWYQIPVCFYNNTEAMKLNAPENIWVQLKGRRSTLLNIDSKNLAAHINATDLKQGPNNIIINEEHLLLAQNINVADYIPQNLTVTLDGLISASNELKTEAVAT